MSDMSGGALDDWVKWLVGLLVPIFGTGMWASHKHLSDRIDLNREKAQERSEEAVSRAEEGDSHIWASIDKLRDQFAAHQQLTQAFHLELATKIGQLVSRQDLRVEVENVVNRITAAMKENK